MRSLWLDYQLDEPGRHRPGLLLLISSLVLTALLFAQYFSIAEKLTTAGTQVSKLKRGAEHQRLFENPNGARVNVEGQQRSPILSAGRWESLFTSLEKAGSDSMTLLRLEPGPREISITGEAKDLAAAMEYVQRLQSVPVFTNAHLTESETLKEHPRHPVRFTLVADWRGAPR